MPAELVGYVADGVQNQLRRMDMVKASQALGLLIPKVAKAYGNRSDLDEFTVKQCIDIALDDYGHLGIEEIPVAYRLWASGTIKALEMWGGQFNGAQFGRVLSAYDENRRQIWAELEKAKRAEEEAAEAERKRQADEAYRASFPQRLEAMIAAAPAGTYTGWQSMEPHWYDLCKQHQLLGLNAEQVADIWERAQAYAKAESFARLEDEKSAFRRTTLLRHIEEKTLSRARVIARRISVWEAVVRPMIENNKRK